MALKPFIEEFLFPLFLLFGVMFRILGALAVGLIGGSVLRRSILREASVRFHTPLIYIGTVLLAAAMISGSWSSPGAFAMFGIGMYVGYMFLERRATPTVVEGEVVDVQEPIGDVVVDVDVEPE
jgi:hypothetical protein